MIFNTILFRINGGNEGMNVFIEYLMIDANRF